MFAVLAINFELRWCMLCLLGALKSAVDEHSVKLDETARRQLVACFELSAAIDLSLMQDRASCVATLYIICSVK